MKVVSIIKSGLSHLLLVTVMIGLYVSNTFSQKVDAEYTRKGVTPIFIMSEDSDFPEDFSSLREAFQAAREQLQLPTSMDDNRLNDPIIIKEDMPALTMQLGKGYDDTPVREEIHEKGIPQKIMDIIFDADSSGRYSMQSLVDRVKYNLTDAEVKQLKASAKGLAQGAQDVKWVNDIMNSNYIMAFHFDHLKSNKTLRQESDKENSNEDKEKGFEARGHVFIYHMDFNDTISHQFYTECWAGPNTSGSALKEALAARKKMKYDLKLVNDCGFSTESAQSFKEAFSSDKDLTKKEKFLRIPQQIFESANTCLERKVNVTGETDRFDEAATSLFEADYFPYFYGYAKMGTKQGVVTDKRYYVYENVMKEGKKTQVMRGVLRATTDITENDTMSTGNTPPSTFVQTYGQPLGKGMLIKERNDAGLSLSAGWLYHGEHYMNFRWEVRLSRWMGFTTGFFAYQDIGYTISSITGDEDIYGMELGVSKMFYLLRDFHLSPYAGFRFLPVITYDVGLRFDINLAYWAKLRFSAGYAPISYKENQREPLLNSGQSSSALPDKWDVMLRVNF